MDIVLLAVSDFPSRSFSRELHLVSVSVGSSSVDAGTLHPPSEPQRQTPPGLTYSPELDPDTSPLSPAFTQARSREAILPSG